MGNEEHDEGGLKSRRERVLAESSMVTQDLSFDTLNNSEDVSILVDDPSPRHRVESQKSDNWGFEDDEWE